MGKKAAVKSVEEEVKVVAPKKAIAKAAPAPEPAVVEKKKREKKEKDPDMPKRPLSAFFLYAADHREDVKKKNPSFKSTEIAKQLGTDWEAAKARKDPCVEKYEARAKKLRDEYHAAMETYKADH